MPTTNQHTMRCQHMPGLLDLPNELLVAVSEHVARACRLRLMHHAMVVLSSVCTRLRALIVDTPHLWENISAGWRADDWFACVLARARGQPLRVYVPIDAELPAKQGRLVSCLPAARSVSARFFDDRSEVGRSFWDAFKSPAVCPSTLKLSFERRRTLDLQCFRMEMCEALTSLRLDQVTISDPGTLRLPALRFLKITSSSCPIAFMRGILVHTPRLEHLQLCYVIISRPDPSFSPLQPRSPLPALQCVVLRGRARDITDIILMVPNPSLRFVVELSESGPYAPVWSSTTGMYGSIWRRLQEFWRQAAGGAAAFPAGSVTPHICGSTSGITHTPLGGSSPFRFVSGLGAGAPALSYTGAFAVKNRDPMLDHVKRVHLLCDDLNSSASADIIGASTMPLQRYLDLFPNMEHMDIEGQGSRACAWIEEAFLRGLEPWLAARCERGNPLRSIEFRDCSDELLGFYRVVHGQLLAEVVSWNVGHATDEYWGDDSDPENSDDDY
jgi:hypothetical protein